LRTRVSAWRRSTRFRALFWLSLLCLRWGCVGYRFSFSENGSAALTNDVSLALGFYERAQLEERVKKATGLEL
jgi:hypothetical protein